MASGEDRITTNHDDEDLVEDVDVEEDDDDQSDSASDHHPHVTSNQVTVALPSAGAASDLHHATAIPVKRSAADESRKLFQRLWTDEDEIELLQGFLEYTANRCGPHDTTAFYDQIKTKFQLDFNKNQLVEKLRRLKKKYRNLINKFGSGKDYAFKTPHDQATFEIAAKIWGNLNPSYPNSSSTLVNAGHVSDDDVNVSIDPNFGYCVSPIPNFNGMDGNSSKTPRPKKRNRIGTVKFEEQPQVMHAVPINQNNNNYHTDHVNYNQQIPTGTTVPNVIEETVKGCLTPLLKELLGGGSTMGFNPNGLCCGHGLGGFGRGGMIPFGLLGGDKNAHDERWRKQHILELEVLSKRLELVQDQIKEQLDELRSVKR